MTYIPVVLALTSLLGIWFIADNFDIAILLLSQKSVDTISSQEFAVIPLFVLMGLLISISDIARETFGVAHYVFRKINGGLGVATVAANAVFASITGVSIASAAVFTQVAVPEMLRFGYHPRLAVGIVAGSSVLGMLIPPSILLIVYLYTNGVRRCRGRGRSDFDTCAPQADLGWFLGRDGANRARPPPLSVGCYGGQVSAGCAIWNPPNPCADMNEIIRVT